MKEFKIPEHVEKIHEDIQPEQLKYHHRRVAVAKEFTFDAAHHLHLYDGKCKNLHGHTYKLNIVISGFVNDIGISMDFGEIKDIYKKVIDERLDHRYLNEVLPPMNTSAENLIVWMWEQIDQELIARGKKEEGFRIEELQLYETPTSYALLKREWMETE